MFNDFEPPSDLLDLLKVSPSWKSRGTEGYLSFGGDQELWLDAQGAATLPTEPAIYAIGVRNGIRYPRAKGRMVYIGSAKNIRQRIRTHLKRSHNDLLRDLFLHALSECVICVCRLPSIQYHWLLALEAAALEAFENKFGGPPLCNIAACDSDYVGYCESLVSIDDRADLTGAISIEEFAVLIERRCVWEPSQNWAVNLSLGEDNFQIERAADVPRFYPISCSQELSSNFAAPIDDPDHPEV